MLNSLGRFCVTALLFLSTNHANSTECSPLATGQLNFELNERMQGAASVVIKSGIAAIAEKVEEADILDDATLASSLTREIHALRHFFYRNPDRTKT